MKKRESKRGRLICAIAALLCLVAAFGALFCRYIRNFNQTLMEENRIRLSEVSGHIAVYLKKTAVEQQNKLMIAVSAAAVYPDMKERISFLGGMSDTLGFEYIGIAGRDGMLYSGAFDGPKDISGEAYFQEGLAGRPYITDLTRQIFSDRAVGGVMMSLPVPDHSGQVAVSLLSATSLGADIQMDSFQGEGYSYVIDRNGDLVLHARSMEFNNIFQSLRNVPFDRGYSLEKMKADIEAGQEGMTAYSDLGVSRYAYYQPLAFSGWTVISTVPKGVITEKTSVLSRDLAVMYGSSFLVFLALLAAVCILYLRLESRRRANQSKSAFLANMSHDMRTPMNAIIGMSAIASAHADDPDTVRDCLDKISFSSKHLLGLINDVLDMSRIETGKMSLSHEPMSLAEIMASSINITYPAILAKGQHFSVCPCQLRHEYFIGDSLRLSQIFVNILNNAVKFTPEGGEITVSIEELETTDEHSAKLRFHFKDTGIGMKPEFLKRIFSAFTRERDSRVDKTEGSGLGMAITKQIVEQMGGEIEVFSEVGKGSTFVVTLCLPLDLNPPEEQKAPSCRVLVAGGDEFPAREVVRTLESIGVRAGWVPDGERACERLLAAHREGEDYDVLFVERAVFLSGSLEAIKSASPACPKLVLFAYSWEDIRAEAAEEGICLFVQRPLFRSTLLACLNEVFAPGTNRDFAGAKYDFTGKVFLLAEDNELNMEIIRVTLEEAGGITACAENGQVCVELFRASETGHFDLVLMDIQMPEMNGYEAAREIRRLNRGDADVPILAMSANAYAEDIEAAKAAGMTGYLTKPIDMELWLREINKQIFPSAGAGGIPRQSN